MRPQWTKEQQKVIDLRDRNILVSAAAGSGKTAVLVERIIEKITDREHPVDIDRLLVVTFTRAAASEMRSRIGAALEEKMQECPEDTNLQRQATLLHNAQITTIDSFCQYIIRNYFHVIGLDPVFRVGDETDLKIIKKEVLEQLIEERYAEAKNTGKQNFLEFTDIFAPGRTDRGIEDLVLHLYEVAVSYPWPESRLQDWERLYQCETLEELEESQWMQCLTEQVAKTVKEYRVLAQRALILCQEADGPEMYLEMIQSDLNQLEKIGQVVGYEEFYREISMWNPARLSTKRGSGVSAEKKEEVKALRDMYQKNGIAVLKKSFFYQAPEEMLQDIQRMAEPVHELIQLTIDFSKAFAQRKREDGIVDFTDMEHFALEILVDRDESGREVPSATAQELQEYYEEILTDEYQDSNFVQELLLTSLCRAPEQAPYLFMVGDVKQSIYQFRLARPELFMEKYNSYTTEESRCQRIDLHQNFRSRAEVLESANYLFERIMQKDLGGIVYDDAARLVPGADFGECDQRTAGKTELILIEQKGEEDEVLEKRTLEAAAIGEKIKEMVQGENPLYVRGKSGYRPVEYRDIVILLRSLSGWSEAFIETLTEMGIPAYSATKTGYFSAAEVETVLDFLRIIDNPRQDIPLAAVLRSCLVGLSDEELAYLGTVSDTLNYWDAVCSWLGKNDGEAEEQSRGIPAEYADVLRQKLSCFWDMLEHYRKEARTSSVYELLRMIYRETDYYNMMSVMPAGEKRAANLDILLQQAIEFAENGHAGIFAFCRYIESLRKSDIDFGEASVTGEQANAVQIMSIHKSKGLEFPVVFVAGLGKQFNLQDARKSTIIDMDFGVGADYVDLNLRLKQPTLVKKFMADHIRQNTLAEEVRILYVALTRAKEKLILTGTGAGLEKKMEKWRQKGRFLNRSILLGAQTYLDWIVPALADRIEQENDLFSLELQYQTDLVMQEKEELKNDLIQRQGLKTWDLDEVYDEAMAEAVNQRRTYRYPYEQEQNLQVKVSVSELKRLTMERMERITEEYYVEMDRPVQRGTAPRPKFRQGEVRASGAERGTLYHLVMEHLPYEELQAEYDFDRLFSGLCEKGYLTEEDKKCLEPEYFQKFCESGIGQRMKAAAERGLLRREQLFMLGLPAAEVYPDTSSKETVMIQGIIDAYFEEDDQLVLVDYKTDSVKDMTGRELAEKYQVQLEYYAQALERLVGKKVREKIIYSFALGKEITV